MLIILHDQNAKVRNKRAVSNDVGKFDLGSGGWKESRRTTHRIVWGRDGHNCWQFGPSSNSWMTAEQAPTQRQHPEDAGKLGCCFQMGTCWREQGTEQQNPSSVIVQTSTNAKPATRDHL